MNISDTIQKQDIDLDFWSDEYTALLGIRQNEHTRARWNHIFEEHKKKYPKSEPSEDYIFCEYHADKDEVVYWLDLDNDVYELTQELRSDGLDDMVRSVALAGC